MGFWLPVFMSYLDLIDAEFCYFFIKSGYLSDPVQRATLCKLLGSQKLLRWIIMVWFLDLDSFGIIYIYIFFWHYHTSYHCIKCVSALVTMFLKKRLVNILSSILVKFWILWECYFSFCTYPVYYYPARIG